MPPDTPKGKSTPPRAKNRPKPAAGAAEGDAAEGDAAEGDAAATVVEEPIAKGPGAGKRAQRVPAEGKSD